MWSSRHWAPAFAGVTLALAGMTLAACGFQLRGEPTFGLASISVTAVQPSAVTTEIRRSLAQGSTTVVAKEADATANLRILGESREKTVHTITGTGRVYEFQLRLAVRFEVRKPGQELPLVPPTEIETRRLITYSETAPTAKEVEEQLLFKDMQVELAGRILRQVAVAQRGES